MSTSTRTKTRTTASSAALVVFWSSGFIGAELGTRAASATTLLAWRYVVVSAVLGTVWAIRRERVAPAVLRRLGLIGLLNQVGYLGCIVTAVALGVPAGTTALVAALQPLVVAVLAAAVLGERSTTTQTFGLGIGLAGVALVVSGDLSLAGAPWWAYVLPVLGMAALSTGTVLQQRWQPPGSLVLTLTVQTGTATVVFVAAAVATRDIAPPSTPGFWLAVAWVVVLSTFGGYGALMSIVRTRGAAWASVLMYLTPPVTLVWAYLMFGDRIGPVGWSGLLVAGVGVALALRGGESRRQGRTPDQHDPGASEVDRPTRATSVV